MVTLLQYVGDLLLASSSKELCLEGMKRLLIELGELDYRTSAKKAQNCSQQVSYLGYLLKEGKRWRSEARKESVLHTLLSTNQNKSESFWAQQVSVAYGYLGLLRWWLHYTHSPRTNSSLSGEKKKNRLLMPLTQP